MGVCDRCVSSNFGKSCVCVGANYTYHCSNHDELINILLMKKKIGKKHARSHTISNNNNNNNSGDIHKLTDFDKNKSMEFDWIHHDDDDGNF